MGHLCLIIVHFHHYAFTSAEMAKISALQFDPIKKVLSLVKVDLPVVTGKNDVVVKVAFAGICGTDLHVLDGSFPCIDRPFILGHEFCGTVTALGCEVTHVALGDRVVVDPISACFTCRYCASGFYHQCLKKGLHSILGIFCDGGWAQFAKVDAKQIHRIPDKLSFKQAVLCEPISCVSHGWDIVSPISIGSTVLISGAGIIGNLWSSILHHTGHRKVFISEPVAARRKLTENLETDYTCLSPDELKDTKMKNPEFGVDVHIDCSGNGKAMEEGFDLLLNGGKMCIFGIAPPDAKIKISPFDIYKKELQIVGVLLNKYCFPKALGFIEAMGSRYIDYERLGIQVFTLDNYQEAIETLKKGDISKVVFCVDPSAQ